MLAFIDESGTPHPNDSCGTWSLAAVCIPRGRSRQLAQLIWGLKVKHYGAPAHGGMPMIELKAQRTLSRTRFFRSRIGHAKAKRAWGLGRSVFSAVHVFPDMRIFAITGKRPSAIPSTPRGLLPWHYVFLLQRIHLYALQLGQGTLATVVFDQKDPDIDSQLSHAFTYFLLKTNDGKRMTNILDVAMFVTSTATYGVQMADMVAGCLRQESEFWFHRGNDPYIKTIRRYAAIARGKTQDLTDASGPRILSGIY